MFHRNKNSKDGRVATCKECLSQYYLENRDVLKEQANEYRKEHRDRYLEYNKQYYKINKKKMLKRSSKYIKKNIVWFKKIYKDWCQNNRDKISEYQRNRKAKMKELPYTLIDEEWEQIKLEFDSKCCYCGCELPLQKYHFIPVSENGGYTADNIIPSCVSCNSSKGNKDFFEWYPNYEFYNEEREIHILNHLGYINELKNNK